MLNRKKHNNKKSEPKKSEPTKFPCSKPGKMHHKQAGKMFYIGNHKIGRCVLGGKGKFFKITLKHTIKNQK